ncbi:Protein of unknown function [Tessaracoccus bendigoensis DSM 12906]|uniref:DUF4233 domain-containing protein n=1 Tax=Tessaracoccus bendigoensis DSM 12906 TaxID=1123357 RepID=A0A1M6BYM4_9ACTN|nr:DUF4233 domain-containing protein [Tessaracoccus bendigoensis]SHI53895.1 Protein of unknown function [Tessaracoccus bendigoensis DSM 12906]
MTLAPDNPMRVPAMSTLIFQIIVVWLGYIGMIQVAEVGLGIAAGWCAAVSVLCLVGAGGLRHRWGYLVGWAAQAGTIALGLLTPWMYAMGIIFALIWITCIVLGRRIETRPREESAG